ncbi:MAG: hypothetical protein ACOC23_07220 [Thermodesulfobacteriota bacterium]
MKKTLTGLALLMIVALLLMPALAFGAKWWLLGTVKGVNTQETVVALRLVPRGEPDENFVVETSANKHGQYAFSDPETGLPPAAYRLVVYVQFNKVMEVSLDGIKPHGRVPPITLKF